MAYTPTVWKNGEAPAINAENLNKIEQGIVNANTAANQALEQGLKITTLYDGECTQNEGHSFQNTLPEKAKLIMFFAQYNPYTEPGSGIIPVPVNSTMQYTFDVARNNNINAFLRYFVSIDTKNNFVSVSCKQGQIAAGKIIFSEYPGALTRLLVVAI